MAWPPTTHQDVQDEITAIRAAWTAYTPTWTAATTNPTLGNGSIVGRYRQIGKTVTFSVALTIGSTTNIGQGAYGFGLPVASRSVNECVVVAFQDGPLYPLMGRANQSDATKVVLYVVGTGQAVNHTNTSPANGTVIRITGTYEAA